MDILIPALGRSLLLAGIAASFACFLAVIAAAAAKNAGQGSFLETLLRSAAAVPLVSSGIVLGLGWLMVYGREQSRSIWALALIHGISALPFAFNSVSAGLRDLPPNTLNAASVFGAGPVRRILTVELPLSARRLRSAWAFSAAISLGELNGVLMLGMEKWETLPLLIYRAVGAYRYGIACAAGTILVICFITAFLVSEISFPKRVR
jgi:thiamine transport system permease protein